MIGHFADYSISQGVDSSEWLEASQKTAQVRSWLYISLRTRRGFMFSMLKVPHLRYTFFLTFSCTDFSASDSMALPEHHNNAFSDCDKLVFLRCSLH